MQASELRKIGFPNGPVLQKAQQACGNLAGQGHDKEEIREIMESVQNTPGLFGDVDPVQELVETYQEWLDRKPREEPVDYTVWGDVDEQAIQQMDNACRLPIAVKGAIMPDGHLGYGLPIGGVLATKDAIIPGAVGYDIGCRMQLSVTSIQEKPDKDLLCTLLDEETAFGRGASFDNSRDHEVMEEIDWGDLPVDIDKGWHQLGSSGSGNHFAEWGWVDGHLALLTHSGSRGPGWNVSQHFMDIAEERCAQLPDEMRGLSWLSLDSDAGQAYLQSMRQMGDYASACHDVIHDSILRRLGCPVIDRIENHHNFAWIEDGYVVHRKGATPSSEGEIGIVPGTMCDPSYIVCGRGNEAAMDSSAHGAGRRMSRTEARKRYDQDYIEKVLQLRDVELLSAGVDEAPGAYKSIHNVMGDQRELVAPIGMFHPWIVKMAPDDDTPPWIE